MGVWTKRGVGRGLGHGVGHGLPYGLPHGPSHGPSVVNFVKTRLSIAAKLCKQRAPSIAVTSTTLFRPLGGVSLKFSGVDKTCGRPWPTVDQFF